ncbi:hypothetical protein QR680_002900 [Steinernema hermaphroditum]|uniref:Uncharacterized protein n=1 Tax=Steinernema hermaphroditum TaxID=289476 RepID=A0AA39H755_9BILA|nr:hypothetical protein QR680_002900 [Steinernema hermaphroditum]
MDRSKMKMRELNGAPEETQARQALPSRLHSVAWLLLVGICPDIPLKVISTAADFYGRPGPKAFIDYIIFKKNPPPPRPPPTPILQEVMKMQRKR